MKKVWEWYENFSDIVYVTDLDTNELVYMNKVGRQRYGFSKPEDYIGKKCHNVLRHSDVSCRDCNNPQLREGQFLERQRWNAVLGKMFSIKDTMIVDGDRKYRLEMAIDLTLQSDKHRVLEEYRRNEEMINRALKISLGERGAVRSLERLLSYLGDALEAQRMYIFEEQPDGTVSNTYEWCSPGTTPEKENLQNVPFEAVQHWYDEFHKGNAVVIKDLDAIKDEYPITYSYLKPQNIQTVVVNPIYDGNHIIGFYGVDNAPTERLNNISVLFETIGHFITSILIRVTLVKKLESMSLYDQLTELKNRHAMEYYVSHLDRGCTLGVIFADITGLKRVNDSQGHKAGDELICRCAKLLNEYFGDYEVFRIGGDEFCILCKKIEKERMETMITGMKQQMKERNAVLAVGSVWVDYYEENFESLLSRADSEMYLDKRAHYTQPEMNRRQTDQKE